MPEKKPNWFTRTLRTFTGESSPPIDPAATPDLIFGQPPPPPPAENENDTMQRRFASWAMVRAGLIQPGNNALTHHEELPAGSYGGPGMVVAHECNTAGRDFVVGDIHGEFSKLQEALQALEFDRTRDRLFCAGDLVDRGAESESAGDWIAEPWFHSARGNHEQMRVDKLIDRVNSDLEWEARKLGQADEVGTDARRRALDEAFREEPLTAAFVELPLMREVDTDAGRVGIVHADVPEDRTWEEFRQALIDGDRTDTATCMFSYRNPHAWAVRGDIHRVIVGHSRCPNPEASGNVLNINNDDLMSLVQIQPGPWRVFRYPTWEPGSYFTKSESGFAHVTPGELFEEEVPELVDAPDAAVLRVASWAQPYFSVLRDQYWWADGLADHAVEEHGVNESGRDFALGPAYDCEAAVERLLKHVRFNRRRDRLFTLEVADFYWRKLTPPVLRRQQQRWCHALRQHQEVLLEHRHRIDDESEREAWRIHLRQRPLVMTVDTPRGKVVLHSGHPPPDRDWDGWRQGLLAGDVVDCQMAHTGPLSREALDIKNHWAKKYRPPPRDPSVRGVWRTIHAGVDQETNPPSGAWGDSLALGLSTDKPRYQVPKHVHLAQFHPGCWRMWSLPADESASMNEPIVERFEPES